MLTLVRGRADRLRNLMAELARQSVPPRELVIAWMQPERAADLPDPGCPVRHRHVAGEPMPLAA
ncbi:glycosyltransferase family 2 protein, partial [Methylobacterium sp. WL103]